MNRKQIALLTVAALVACLTAFSAGRHIGLANETGGMLTNLSAASASSSPKTSKPRSEQIDLTNARITNLGSLGPEEIFDLVSNADATLRHKWQRELEEMPFGPAKCAAVMSFYKALVQIDSNAAAQLVLISKDPVTREMAIRGVTAAAPPSAMADLAKMLDELGPDELRGHLERVIWTWTQVDPAAAAEYIERHSNDLPRNAHYLLLHNWTTVDPSAAKAWLDRVHLDDEKASQAIKGYVGGLLDSDRNAALDYLVSHANEPTCHLALVTVGADSFVKSPDEAREFVMRLPNRQAQESIISHITELTTSYWTNDWKRSPDEIAKWLITLPPDLWREYIGQTEAEWNAMDKNAFRGWLDQLPPEKRDDAVAAYCRTIGPADLEQAISLAGGITDTAVREASFRDLVSESNRSRAEILKVLNAVQLPPSKRESLIRLLPDE